MFKIKVLFRYFLASLVIVIPFLVIGGAIFGKIGFFVGGVLGLFGVAGITFYSEKLTTAIFQVNSQEIKGLKRSFEIASEGFLGPLPKLYVFVDPTPDVLVIRSLGGRGTILLSQGLVGLLNEEELQMTLKVSLARTNEPGSVFRSFCSLLVTWVLMLSPKGWVQLVFSEKCLTKREEYLLNPLSAMGFVILFPVIRFFLTLIQLPGIKKTVWESDTVFLSATQKVAQAAYVLGMDRGQQVFSLFSRS